MGTDDVYYLNYVFDGSVYFSLYIVKYNRQFLVKQFLRS